MKRIILVVLIIALFTTPCFAQEIETDGIFSIEGTLWAVCRIGIEDDFPFFNVGCSEMGFYQGTLYDCSNEDGCWNTYIPYVDSPVVSIAYFISFRLNGSAIDLYIMQPGGFGVYTSLGWMISFTCIPPYCFEAYFRVGIMFKVEDGWTPPEDAPITE